MDAKGIEMHVDRANEITMTAKPAAPTDPVSAPGLVCVPADRTPARGSSFRAGEARDADLFGFMGEIVDVATVFPLRHATIVMSAIVPIAHAMRIADEDRSHLVLGTKVDDLARGFVPQIADASLSPSACRVPGSLQLLPAPGVLLATALLLGDLPELSASLPLEGSNAAPGHDQRFARAGRDGSQMDFSEVHRRLGSPGSRYRLLNLDTDMQLEAPVPDERTGSGVFWQGDGQDERRITPAHWQYDASLLLVDGLGGPLDRIELLRAPGILHAHLGVLSAQRACRLHVCEEGMDDLLYSLGVELEPTLRSLLQLALPRPRRMGNAGLFLEFHTAVPHESRFHLRLF